MQANTIVGVGVNNLAEVRQVVKVESSEDIGRQELEEGKTSSLSDFHIRSPNIKKKRMDFGHGTQNEYLWIYTKSNQEASELNHNEPTLVEKVRLQDVKTHKFIDKWDRGFILDSKRSISYNETYRTRKAL